MAALFKVKALYEFEAKEEDDLGFAGNQVIDVTEEIDDNWLEGRYTDASGATRSGIFPREFVEKYEPEVPTRPARPPRQKQEPAPVAAPAPLQRESEEVEAQDEAPPVPATSKPQPPPVDIPATTARQEEVRSPPSASSQKTAEPPAAPKPAPAEPAKETAAKKPPPIAAKSNAFRDRIAAFNQPAAAPIAPMVPGGPKPSGAFIKKPFVAPPPMANSYVPPPKVEPVHKPYIREEDPEIRRRQEEDHAAAEAAGLTNDGQAEQGEDEDAPKPTTLKERIARLQQQQLEQAQRRAEGTSKKEKKPPTKKPSESSEQGIAEGEDDDLEQERSRDANERQSLDVSRERPRVPSSQRKPSIPMSPGPAAPESELVSDGNEADQSAAGETTEDDTGTIGPEDSDERHAPHAPPRATAPPRREPDAADEGEATEDAEGEEDEDSMDEETRKRMELRERMAKMSGGMGMGPMFGPPGGMPLPGAAPAKKRKEKKQSEEGAPSSPPPPQQRIPMIPVPGMQRVASPESEAVRQAAERDEAAGNRDVDDEQPLPQPRRSTHEERGAPPPVPKDSRPSQDRAPPPPVPSTSEVPTPMPPVPASRPVPQPPPHAAPMSPGPGSESDDEMPAETSGVDTPGPLPLRQGSGAPPVPGSAAHQSSEPRRMSYFGTEPQSATSDRRNSRPPPPIPGSPLTSPRPPPPPPPGQAPSRKSTDLQTAKNERGESDYEGDYDTDIASSAKHKDALKAHVREDSIESTTADDVGVPPVPPPHTSAPRAVPPPPPSQAPAKSRPSMDAPRAPPPIPPATSRPVPEALNPGEDDEDYDPYRYDGQSRPAPPPVPGGVPIVVPPVPPRDPEPESSADDLYSTTPPRKSTEQPSRAVPAPPPAQPPPPARAPPRESLDVQRSNTTARRSMDQPRPSGDNGQMAQELDLAEKLTWWTASQPLPPVLQSRNGIDILSECEESTTSKRGGRTTISKDIYVLYMDYSQTIITARYDSANPADAQLEQQHRPPPPKPRQDQLEAYWQRFGRNIAETANSLGHAKKDTTVGEGSPASLPLELIKSNQAALQPVGNKTYGALVYANLANASTQQFDEIRPGDIVTLRNTRFEGTHGAMKHKYKQEYGQMHVAIVEEWDGTRRAIRAWEQGREKPKVRSEKFRLGDLRSGEVKVWRVVGRDYVEWESGS